MKQLAIILSLLLITFTACEKDQEMVKVLPADQLVAPVLTYTGGDIEVTENNQNSVLTFTWTPADFGVATAVSYSLYIKAGDNAPSLLASATGESAELKYSAVNVAALRAGGFAGMPANVKVYLTAEIGSAYAVASNEVAFAVTPFEVVPLSLFMVGNVLESDKEWKEGNYTYIMFRDANLSEDETMTTRFKSGGDGGGFKFIPGDFLGKWDKAYGQKSAGVLSTVDAGNISDIGADGYYTIVANTTKLTYSVTPYDATGKPTYTSVTFGDAPLTQTAYDPHMWVAEDVTLTAADAPHFTVDGTAFGAASFPYGKAVAGGDAVRVKAGNYFVKFSDLTGHYVFHETIPLGEVTPPVLNTPTETAIVVSADNRSSKLTFSWSAAVFSASPDVTYTLRARLGDNGDAQTVEGSSTTATSCEVTYGALNNAARAAGAVDGTATDVQLFVEAAITTPSASVNSDPIAISITPMEFTYPDAVYMIGQDFGGWGWSNSGVVEMTPVHSHDGQFWCVRYFTAANGFKWNTIRDWGGDFNSLGTNTGFTTADGNASVPADGFYSVYVDYTTNTITIEPAQVFGMGDCFGGWNTGQYPFTANGTVMKITTTATGELRIYATSSAAQGVDWWQMEFVILNDEIEYRGKGDDQTRVSVDAGKTITLDFNAGTGKIE